jgi:uncharacterized protein (DUF1501 family)
MPVTRRVFIRHGALAAAAGAALPSLRNAATSAEKPQNRPRRLVVIFERGGADGLSIVVPHGEPSYYTMRPTINIPRAKVLDLDGFFGLHPALAALQPLWAARHLAIVHAAGSPHPTRSHFEAQDFLESGTPGDSTTKDGWLNRALRPVRRRADFPFRAVALNASLPRILCGSEPAMTVSNNNIVGSNPGLNTAQISSTLESKYLRWANTRLKETCSENSESMKLLQAAKFDRYAPARGANYARGNFGDSLRQLARLIKANVGLEVAFVEIGGWDHHANQGGTEGRLANLLREFSLSLAAFWIDLGDLAEDTVVITMSEFGRSARENQDRGTDHGHAGAMLIMGGRVRGGTVYGRWPGLEPAQLHQGRDLALTTDFRQVLGEAIHAQLGNHNLDAVFPGFSHAPESFLNLLR